VGAKAVAVALAAALLAGCEFGSDSGKAEFIRQADEICARHERQIALIPQPQTFFRDFAVYMRRVVPIARQQNQELRRLQAPEDEAADFRRMVGLLDQQLDLWAEAGEQAYAGNDQRAQQAYSSSAAPGEEAQRIAGEIGFFSCARPEG
jgi:hypothetical protein